VIAKPSYLSSVDIHVHNGQLHGFEDSQRCDRVFHWEGAPTLVLCGGKAMTDLLLQKMP